MKRISYLFLLTVFGLFMTALAFAQGSMSDSTKKETPAQQNAEEKKETPAQERAEEKTENKTKAHHTTAAKHKAPKMAAVDINSASKEDLMKVPGMTDEMADKIVAGRPYKSRTELTSKSVMTKAEYAKMKGHLVAKKEKASAATAK